MNRLAAALILATLAGWVAVTASRGWRDGTMPLLLSSEINPLRFDRGGSPAFFLAALAFNISLAGGFAGAALLVLLGPR